MSTWTATKNWVAGPVTSAEMDTYVSGNDDYLKDAIDLHGLTSSSTRQQVKSALCGVKAVRSAVQNLTDSTTESCVFTAADTWDSDAFHDPASNAARITIPTGLDGYYLCVGWASFASNATGYRRLFIEKNGTNGTGTQMAETDSAPLSVAWRFGVTDIIKLVAGDYLCLTARQTSGGGLNLDDSTFEVVRLFVG